MRAPALVIVPTYNEAPNIVRLLERLKALYGDALDILVVDDGSPDGTASLVREVMQRYEGIYLMERNQKLGLGTAYIAGFRYALQEGYRRIVEMDADFSHDPAVIAELLRASEGADLVIGSRYVGGRVNVVNWPLARLVLSKGASIYTRLVTGMPVEDPTSGFKCFRRELLSSIDLDAVRSQGYSFQIEMNFRAWKAGATIRELPIVFTDRTVGSSKMTKSNIREAVWMVWRLKWLAVVGRV